MPKALSANKKSTRALRAFGRPIDPTDFDVRILKIDFFTLSHGFLRAVVTDVDSGESWILDDVRRQSAQSMC